MHAKSFHELRVWQVGMELAEEIYRLARQLPPEERFAMSLQLKRTAISIPSNIAEGSGYGKSRRNTHLVRIALGSNLELQTQLLLVERLGLADAEQVRPQLDRAIELGKMLNNLIKSHARTHLTNNQPPTTNN